MKHVMRWLALILIVGMLGVPSIARADVAPPSHPPGLIRDLRQKAHKSVC